MKSRFLSISALVLLFFFACGGNPAADGRGFRETASVPGGNSPEGPFNESPPQIHESRIADHTGKAEGRDIPRWVEAYLAGGDAGVDALPEYENVYAFIGENRMMIETEPQGALPAPLENWRRNFDVGRAFPRLAAARIRYRFIRGLSASAADVYGKCYDASVKAAYAARYSGPWKEGDFWVREEPGENSEGDGSYRCLVFVLVPKDIFEREVQEMLNPLKDLGTKDQNSAFEKTLEVFFEGF
ncbi:MAG: hypothetical protein LBI67_07995 [Treponema sp.]|nr:hypothetical protein [Treponema sp.]